MECGTNENDPSLGQHLVKGLYAFEIINLWMKNNRLYGELKFTSSFSNKFAVQSKERKDAILQYGNAVLC